MKNASMNGIFSRNVEIFISLAKTKSFQKTASIFGLSTSSISRELVTLENKLKVTLVDRSCRPLILTPESLDHPPAVKRSTAVFDSGTEGCLRQPQATRGQVLRGIKPPAAFGGR
uniref:helix-turn-helix domain-containing protein n=1 Tax=Sutterella wadsworthensis TaxID=40545 RepID=UPI00242CD69E